MKDYYKILGIEPNASSAEVKTAYRKLAHQFHPDKQQDDNSEQFNELNEAYQILSNSEKRKLYDDRLKYGDWIDIVIMAQQQYQASQQKNYSAHNQQQQQTYRKVKLKRKKNIPDTDFKANSKYFRILSIVVLLFALLIITDAFLPENIETNNVVNINYSNNFLGTNRRGLQFENDDFLKYIQKEMAVDVHLSPIFGVIKSVYAENKNELVSGEPGGTIYHRFSFFLIIMLFTSLLGTFLKKQYKLICDMGIISLILFFIVLFLTLI